LFLENKYARMRAVLSVQNYYEAAVAQLVEHHVAKSEVNATTYVEESSLVSRSKIVG